MTHPRKTIRDAIVTALKDAEIVDDNRVFANRSLPLEQEDIPAIMVYNGEENSTSAEYSSGNLIRDSQIVVEVVAQESKDKCLDDVLDEFAVDVETAMLEDPLFGGLCIDSYLLKTEFSTRTDAAKPTGSIMLTFFMRYEH